MSEEKMMILNMLKDGKITADEAQKLLEAVEDEGEPVSARPTEKEEIKIDLEEMKAGLKEGFKDLGKTMEGTIRSVVKGFKSLDIGNVVSTAFGSSKESAEKELILSAHDLSGINLRTQSGDVSFSGTDTDDVLIHAIVTARGSDQENARERAERIELLHEIEDGTLIVKDSGTRMHITGPYSVDYRVTLPRKFDAKIQTSDGDVAIRSLDGEISINNYSGDIHCKECSESLRAITKSGDVEIEGFTGEINIKSLSGDLTLSDIVSGAITCNTLSGDIEGSLNPTADSKISAKTLSGDIELELDATAELEIQANTLSGDITCDLPVHDIEKRDHRFTALLNAGTGSMNLSTKSGDIDLQPLD
jgi:DUF4097 and DUF4098 domain-containing protein YvlB